MLLLLSSCTRVVEADFVEPARRIQVGVSEETWVYARKGESSLARNLGRIPLVGEALFVEPFPSSGDPTVKQVTIVFQNNIVRSCKVVMSSPDAAGRTTVYGCGELQ